MPATLERRVYHTEFRDVKGSNGRQKWATAVTYNTVDDYGTLWVPGVFDEALDTRMPTILYGHDWGNLDHVLGKGIDHRQTPDDVGPAGVDVLIEFDDPEFVPMVRQALWQVNNKTLRDVSVGFEREEWRTRDKLSDDEKTTGAEEAMVKAGMDELSIVVRGAVTGAQLRTKGKRMAAIDLDAVLELGRRQLAGEITKEEAQAAIGLLAAEPEAPTKSEGVAEPTEEETAAAAALDAEADAALASIGRSRR